ncbi:hypothetical protein [Acetobacter conturbans]|uniref:Uncharacterized protein n=1 Tax=Acetobacter conturbans TaxID=1737472 RepID=A0ABX0K6X4_9PROT|nr:hypothetical protein [Acetobacter conturbans]NHN89154.1 hypothetical protein [Acetobacter conturbans]
MSPNVLRMPHCPEASPLLISHSLLQLADVVWKAGLTGVADELVMLAHTAIDRGGEEDEPHECHVAAGLSVIHPPLPTPGKGLRSL